MLQEGKYKKIRMHVFQSSHIASAAIMEISIQPLLKEVAFSQHSTAGRSVFWLNILWVLMWLREYSSTDSTPISATHLLVWQQG